MLEGKNVNLRIMEKEDSPVMQGWLNSLDFAGEYEPARAKRRLGALRKRRGLFLGKNRVLSQHSGSGEYIIQVNIG